MKTHNILVASVLLSIVGTAQAGLFTATWEKTDATFSSLLYTEKATIVASHGTGADNAYVVKAESGYYLCTVTVNDQSCMRLKNPDASKK